MGVLLDRVIPILLLLLVNANFSLYSVLASLAFKSSSISPIAFALTRDLIACACFAAALLVTSRHPAASHGPLIPAREHAALFFVLGLLGVFSSMYGALSISLTSATAYGLMTPAVPCITLLVSFALRLEVFHLREASSWIKLGGIGLSVSGAVLIVSSYVSHASGTSGTLLGYLYLILQKAGVATYPLLQKRMLETLPYSSLTLASWAYFSGVTLIALNASTTATLAPDWDFTPTAAVAVIFAGVFASFANYAAMAWANARIGPVLVMSFYPLQSLLAPLLSSLLLKSVIGVEAAAGGGAIVAGLFLVLWAKWREGSPSTGIIDVDAARAEALTLVLSAGDVDAIAAAATAEGDSGAARAVLPLLERSLSSHALGEGGSRGEELSLLAGGRGAPSRPRAATATALGAVAVERVEARRRMLQRERSVVVGMT